MAPRVGGYECAVPPSVYWSLREDDAFEQYSAQREGNVFTVKSRTEEDGVITRVAEVTAEKNPIPSALRKTLGCTEGFTFTITEKWRADGFDASCPMTFVTAPAVMRDRIFVTGSQWVEPNGKGGSKIFFSLDVKVKMGGGVGGALSRGISSGTFSAYKATPGRAMEFLALRRASLRASLDAGLAPPVAAAGSSDGDAGGVAGGTTAAASDDEWKRKRARLRWRIALMSVRFRRVLEEEEEKSRRSVAYEGWVDEPRTEGFGPTRHTTFRVCTQVARDGQGSFHTVRARRQRSSKPEALDRDSSGRPHDPRSHVGFGGFRRCCWTALALHDCPRVALA